MRRAGDLPLSFAQQRLWFIDQLEPGSSAYNIPVAVRVKGVLNEKALEQTLTELVRRHEVLRTTFPSASGRPVQRIAPPGRVDLRVVRLDGLAEDDRAGEVSKLAGAEAKEPFDLGRVRS
jgi:hypothetical protein